jgi:hypothetical protein
MEQITEHDANTSETVVRDMTKTELAQYTADQKAIAELSNLDLTRAKLKAETLAKLGLTADEVAALLS